MEHKLAVMGEQQRQNCIAYGMQDFRLWQFGIGDVYDVLGIHRETNEAERWQANSDHWPGEQSIWLRLVTELSPPRTLDHMHLHIGRSTFHRRKPR